MSNLSTLFDLVGVMARRRYQLGERCFASLGLNHTEARLLTLLAERDGTATQDELSNRLTIDRSNAGRALKELERAGYVRRSHAPEDRRTRAVAMTPKGKEAARDIAVLRAGLAETFFGGLSEQDAGTIVDLLNRALQNQTDHMSHKGDA